MNEIKITPILPYSIAHSMFLGELAMLFRQTNEHKLPMMIEVIKNADIRLSLFRD